MKEAVDDIMVTLNEAASEGGMVGGMVESIAEAMGRVSLLRHWWRMYVWSNVKSAQVVQIDAAFTHIRYLTCLKWALPVGVIPRWVCWESLSVTLISSVDERL